MFCFLVLQKTPGKKLVTGYILYSSDVRRAVAQKYPDSSFGEISRIVGNEVRFMFVYYYIVTWFLVVLVAYFSEPISALSFRLLKKEKLFSSFFNVTYSLRVVYNIEWW